MLPRSGLYDFKYRFSASNQSIHTGYLRFSIPRLFSNPYYEKQTLWLPKSDTVLFHRWISTQPNWKAPWRRILQQQNTIAIAEARRDQPINFFELTATERALKTCEILTLRHTYNCKCRRRSSLKKIEPWFSKSRLRQSARNSEEAPMLVFCLNTTNTTNNKFQKNAYCNSFSICWTPSKIICL